MNPFLWLIHTLIWLYIYLLIGAAVLSWLIAFNVVNSHNSTVRTIWDFLYRVTEPGLRPIRAIHNAMGSEAAAEPSTYVVTPSVANALFAASS